MVVKPLDSSTRRLTLNTLHPSKPGDPMPKKLPKKCKYLSLAFTKIVLTLIVLKPEPPSTMLAMVFGDNSPKRKPKMLLSPHLLLPRLPLRPKPLCLLRMPPLPLVVLPPRKPLKLPRLLLSSTLNGPTPNNKSDGLNKELPTQRTLLTKLLSTNPGRMVRPILTNGLLSNSRVTTPV